MSRIPRCLLLPFLLALPQAAATQEEPLIAFDHYHTLAEIVKEAALAVDNRTLNM